MTDFTAKSFRMKSISELERLKNYRMAKYRETCLDCFSFLKEILIHYENENGETKSLNIHKYRFLKGSEDDCSTHFTKHSQNEFDSEFIKDWMVEA